MRDILECVVLMVGVGIFPKILQYISFEKYYISSNHCKGLWNVWCGLIKACEQARGQYFLTHIIPHFILAVSYLGRYNKHTKSNDFLINAIIVD